MILSNSLVLFLDGSDHVRSVQMIDIISTIIIVNCRLNDCPFYSVMF